MEIANPIYDVAFKYLMEDHRAAKIFLSTLTSLEIVALELLPQELVIDISEELSAQWQGRQLSVYRLDFSAKVRTRDGMERVIVIELQRTQYAAQTMRFRKYLGKQYMNSTFFIRDPDTGDTHKAGIPVLPIYFLGDKMDEFEHDSVILVEPILKNQHTKTELSGKDAFIAALFHAGILVHIPALHSQPRNELEQMLHIFHTPKGLKNQHTMHVNEADFPTKFHVILRRLQAAAQDKAIRDRMTVEDEFMEELQDYVDQIEEARYRAEQEKHKAEQEKQKAEEAKQKAEEAEQKAEEAEQKAEEAEQKAEEAEQKAEEAEQKAEEALNREKEAVRKQQQAIHLLLNLGLSKAEIAQKMGLSETEI